MCVSNTEAPPTVGPLQFLPLGRIVAESAEPGEVMTLDDLNTSANWLASEIFQHDPAVAVGHPLEWYRDQWGSDLPDKQAVTLRTMTIEQCEQQAVLERYQAGVTDVDVERRLRRADHLDGASLLFLFLSLFVLAGLGIGAATVPTQAELNAAHAAQAAASWRASR